MGKWYMIWLSLLVQGATAQFNLESRVVNEFETVRAFSPQTVEIDLQKQLHLSISPIDPSRLNELCFNYYNLDGRYKQTQSSESEIASLDLLNIDPRIVDPYYIGQLEAGAMCNRLLSMQLLDSYTHALLTARITQGEDYGFRGSEPYCQTGEGRYSDSYNPFFVQQKYLSVFKVKVQNFSDVVLTLNQRDIQLSFNTETLYPLNQKEMQALYSTEEIGKLAILQRLAMPEVLQLAPGQMIEKYLAFPALNEADDRVFFQVFEGNKVQEAGFELNVEQQEKATKFYAFSFKPKRIMLGQYQFYYCLIFENGIGFPLVDDNVFISEEQLGIPCTLLSVFFEISTGKTYYSKKASFKFAEFPNGKVQFSPDER